MLALLPLIALQTENTAPVVSLSVPKSVAAHAKFEAKLTVTFADGLHGYQNPASDPNLIPVVVKLSKGDVKLVSVAYPKGKDMTMEGDSKPTKVYSGTIVIPVKMVAGSKSGDFVMALDYQQCNTSSCFPPSSVQAKATLHVGPKK
jgi:hypothetical protein